jgi:bud site selection protein 20
MADNTTLTDSWLTIYHRVKALKDEPYSQKEAEAAIGLRTDNGPPRTSMSKPKDVEVEMAT